MMKYRKGYKYQLAETYSIHIPIYPGVNVSTEFINLSKHGELTIKSGYAWDGCSGPTIDTKSSMRGGLVHDALYQLLRWEHIHSGLRTLCDEIAHRMWIADGMWEWRANRWLKALNRWADYAADPDNKKEVYEVP